LQAELLQNAWNDYIQLLKNDKNPAVPSFERSALRIKDANSFEVVSTNNLEQKFIERERNKLFSFLRQQLQNDLLQFSVLVEENPEEPAKHETSLTAREQFQKMAEQYPLLKELKDRLGLELDY
jgi:DNA polymerase-3 subunit gamma/tau